MSIAVSSGDRYIASYLASELTQSLGEDDLRFLTRTAIVEVVTPGVAEVVAGCPTRAPAWKAWSRATCSSRRSAGGRSPTATTTCSASSSSPSSSGVSRRATVLHRTAGSLVPRSGQPGPRDRARARRPRAKPRRSSRRPGPRSTTAGTSRPSSVAWVASIRPISSGTRPSPSSPDGSTCSRAGLRMRSGWRPSPTEPWIRASSHGSGSFESQRALLRAVMCPDGPRRMLADASLAVDEARPDSQWHANALWLQSAAHLLLGNLETADDILGEAVADGEYGDADGRRLGAPGGDPDPARRLGWRRGRSRRGPPPPRRPGVRRPAVRPRGVRGGSAGGDPTRRLRPRPGLPRPRPAGPAAGQPCGAVDLGRRAARDRACLPGDLGPGRRPDRCAKRSRSCGGGRHSGS